MTESGSTDKFSNWYPLPSRLNDPQGGTLLTKRQARTWGLVLESRQIHCQALRRGLGWQLLVPENSIAVAMKELRHFEAENQGWPPSPPPPQKLIDNQFSTICVLIALGVFYNVSMHKIAFNGLSSIDWMSTGRIQVGKVMIGEWWRVITALTLHADSLHLMGNLVIGGLFITRLCRVLGAGLGWALLLATGVFGNWINVCLQAPNHLAVGASTAIFGAVGLLGAISMVRSRLSPGLKNRWTLPIAGALGLLAILGVGGENTDLGAHLWGFICGLLLGFPTELLIERYGRPPFVVNCLLIISSCFVVSGAWVFALH